MLGNLNTLSDADLISNADTLRDTYPSDREPSLSYGLVQISALLKPDYFAKRTMHACPVETHTGIDNGFDNDDVTFTNESVFRECTNCIVDNHVETVIPNTAITYCFSYLLVDIQLLW